MTYNEGIDDDIYIYIYIYIYIKTYIYFVFWKAFVVVHVGQRKTVTARK